jgi:hypothetical protein
MKYELYNSVDELLSPETMSFLTGQAIRETQISPIADQVGISGSRIMWVTTDDGDGPRYVLKQMRFDWDWIMVATADNRCRSVALWQSGILDRLSLKVDHGILACAHDGDGWAMLMHDLSGRLLPTGIPIQQDANEQMLCSLAALHATYWESAELNRAELPLCDIRTLFEVTLPVKHRNSFGSLSPGFSKNVLGGVELVEEVYEADVARLLRDLTTDPAPLYQALANYPQTLLHGDYRCANLATGYTSGAGATVYDWQMAAVGPPTLDLMWYVGLGIPSPRPIEECITVYKDALQRLLGDRFDENMWQSMLAIGILCTAVRQCGPATWNARNSESGARRAAFQRDLPWWTQQIRAATQWL